MTPTTQAFALGLVVGAAGVLLLGLAAVPLARWRAQALRDEALQAAMAKHLGRKS